MSSDKKKPSDQNPADQKPMDNTPTPDPFDPARLRLSQDFSASIGVKKALLTVPVKKPAREWYFRVHPDPEYRIQTAVLELKEDREIYLVAPELRSELSTESTFGARELFTCITRQNVLFVWPVKGTDADGKTNDWNRSALEAATKAQEQWVRMQSNMALGAYEVFVAAGDLPAPVWPAISLRDILAIAFKERWIDSLEHPVLRRLRGEI